MIQVGLKARVWVQHRCCPVRFILTLLLLLVCFCPASGQPRRPPPSCCQPRSAPNDLLTDNSTNPASPHLCHHLYHILGSFASPTKVSGLGFNFPAALLSLFSRRQYRGHHSLNQHFQYSICARLTLNQPIAQFKSLKTPFTSESQSDTQLMSSINIHIITHIIKT